MIQKDIVLRLIQDISRFLAKAMGYDGEPALEYFYEVYSEDLKLDAEFLATLTPENILAKLTEEKGFNVYQLEFVAEILTKEGLVLNDLNRTEESTDKLEKALIIFNFVEEELQLFSLERRLTIQQVKGTLANQKSKELDPNQDTLE